MEIIATFVFIIFMLLVSIIWEQRNKINLLEKDRLYLQQRNKRLMVRLNEAAISKED